MKVRAGQAEDLEAVVALERAAAEAPHWPVGVYEAMVQADAGFRGLFVAEDAAGLVGFAVGSCHAGGCGERAGFVRGGARMVPGARRGCGGVGGAGGKPRCNRAVPAAPVYRGRPALSVLPQSRGRRGADAGGAAVNSAPPC